MIDRYFKYIKLSEIMSSVKSDLHLLDDSGLIDEDRVIKIVRFCNEKLGLRIFPTKQVTIPVINNVAEIPKDFYKIEVIGALYSESVTHFPSEHDLSLHFGDCPPTDKTYININAGSCLDICGNCLIVRQPIPNMTKEVLTRKICPLELSPSCKSACTDYCPSTDWKKSKFTVNFDNNEFNLNFCTGEIYLCYLADLTSEDGEPLIPFHDLLTPYYEYSIKQKILEDIFMNSEADVQRKMEYTEQKRISAYIDAWNYIQDLPIHDLEKIEDNRRKDIYNKYYKAFEK